MNVNDIPIEIKKQFENIALSSNIEEVGLIISSNNSLSFFKCNNSSSFNKEKTVEISSKDLFKAYKIGDIKAVIHSHIDEEKFSALDKECCESLDVTIFLFNCSTKKWFELNPSGYKNRYVGRKFEWGKSDCLSLVYDYYQNELNITLPDIFMNRDSLVFIKNKDFFRNKEFFKIAEQNQFECLNKNTQLKTHDILFIKSDENANYPSHLAIYVGKNQMLHQLNNCESKIEYLTSNYKDRISYIFRKTHE